MNYPAKMTKIYDMKGESTINSAIDFAPNAKAIFYQFAMIPKDSSKASSVTFDMEYKAAASKATLLVVNNLINFLSINLYVYFPFRILKD